MPAPKGNKFAAKDKRKIKHIAIMMLPEAANELKNIAKQEKTTMTEVIEKALIARYPQRFDGLF